jgi:hypothetical protein
MGQQHPQGRDRAPVLTKAWGAGGSSPSLLRCPSSGGAGHGFPFTQQLTAMDRAVQSQSRALAQSLVIASVQQA